MNFGTKGCMYCIGLCNKECITQEKKETLEEAAEKYAKQFDYAEDSSPQIDFIEGAKWQAEKMYTEEEVEKIVRDAYTFGEKEFKHFGAFEEWFEQFKKKII